MTNNIAERHAHRASHLADIADGVTDWQAPTPVEEWKAVDVLHHLMTWLPAMLGDAANLPVVPTGDDPPAAWREHSANVQRVLEDEEACARTLSVGGQEMTVAEAIERHYLPDLFMHRWDLATASGQDPELDPETLRGMVEGMTPMRDFLASSGQFGDPIVLDDSHADVDRFAAIIGRDPNWRPPTAG